MEINSIPPSPKNDEPRNAQLTKKVPPMNIMNIKRRRFARSSNDKYVNATVMRRKNETGIRALTIGVQAQL